VRHPGAPRSTSAHAASPHLATARGGGRRATLAACRLTGHARRYTKNERSSFDESTLSLMSMISNTKFSKELTTRQREIKSREMSESDQRAWTKIGSPQWVDFLKYSYYNWRQVRGVKGGGVCQRCSACVRGGRVCAKSVHGA